MAFSFQFAISWFYHGIWVLSSLNLKDETFTQDVAFDSLRVERPFNSSGQLRSLLPGKGL